MRTAKMHKRKNELVELCQHWKTRAPLSLEEVAGPDNAYVQEEEVLDGDAMEEEQKIVTDDGSFPFTFIYALNIL